MSRTCTIVNAWSWHSASEITATGRKAVESRSSAFYFTSAVPGGPAGWSKVWYDIGTGVPQSQRELLLGGEMSMWTDTYCYIAQCVPAADFCNQQLAELWTSIWEHYFQ